MDPFMKCLNSWLLVLSAAGLAWAELDEASQSSPTIKPPPAKVQIIAHRGDNAKAPENTAAALLAGFASGADGCQIDFHSTKDHRLIVTHDENTERCTGVNKLVTQQTFDELRQLDAGQWGSWRGSLFHDVFPSLEEAFALVPDGRVLHLRSYSPAGDLGQVKEAFTKSGLKPHQAVFFSQDLEVCKEFKKLLPQCKAHWVQTYRKHAGGARMPELAALIRQAKGAGADGLSIACDFPIDKTFAKQVRAGGLELHVFTVNYVAQARELREAGVDSITTDRLDLLLKKTEPAK